MFLRKENVFPTWRNFPKLPQRCFLVHRMPPRSGSEPASVFLPKPVKWAHLTDVMYPVKMCPCFGAPCRFLGRSPLENSRSGTTVKFGALWGWVRPALSLRQRQSTSLPIPRNVKEAGLLWELWGIGKFYTPFSAVSSPIIAPS